MAAAAAATPSRAGHRAGGAKLVLRDYDVRIISSQVCVCVCVCVRERERERERECSTVEGPDREEGSALRLLVCVYAALAGVGVCLYTILFSMTASRIHPDEMVACCICTHASCALVGRSILMSVFTCTKLEMHSRQHTACVICAQHVMRSRQQGRRLLV